MDFRSAAAKATQDALRATPMKNWYEMEISGCIPVPGGRMLHCATEVPSLFLSTASCLTVPILTILYFNDVLPYGWFLPLCLANIGLALSAGMVQWFFMRAGLARRTGSLLANNPALPQIKVTIEDGTSHQKIKIVPEDAGACFLDKERQRIIIEGCAYRYVILAEDVLSVQSVSGFGKSATRIICRMSAQKLDFVLDGTTSGAKETFKNSLAPADGANALARNLNRTLFNQDVPTYARVEETPTGTHSKGFKPNV